MTNEEAIKRLKSDIYKYSDFTENPNENEFWTAFDMAIKALEQESCEDAVSPTAEPVGFEEAKKLIYQEWKCKVAKDNSNQRLLVAYQIAIKALKQTRWIPVSERLPKAGEYIGDVDKYYLVQNEYGDMLVARYTHSEYWEQIYQFQPIGDEIVAWMPLPEPYKAESEVPE